MGARRGPSFGPKRFLESHFCGKLWDMSNCNSARIYAHEPTDKEVRSAFSRTSTSTVLGPTYHDSYAGNEWNSCGTNVVALHL